MSKMFDEEITGQLKEIFGEMKNPVHIELFTEENAPAVQEVEDFLNEISAMDERINVSVNKLPDAADKAEKLGIVRAPGFAVLDSEGKDHGIQFYGLPGGHEINSFIYALMAVSGVKEPLPEEITSEVAGFKKDINMKVFVTLGCPHCPGAVSKAHRLAMENSNIKAEMIDANLFPELSEKHNVSSVPKIVFNDGKDFVGNQPMESFMNMLRETQK